MKKFDPFEFLFIHKMDIKIVRILQDYYEEGAR